MLLYKQVVSQQNCSTYQPFLVVLLNINILVTIKQFVSKTNKKTFGKLLIILIHFEINCSNMTIVLFERRKNVLEFCSFSFIEGFEIYYAEPREANCLYTACTVS